MRNSHITSGKRDDRGVVALEFVLVLPFLVMLIFAIAQFGIFFSKKVSVESAARDAARYIALNPDSTSPAGVPGDMEVVPGSVSPCPTGNSTSDAVVQLRLKDGYTFSIPGLALGTKQITATGKMRCSG